MAKKYDDEEFGSGLAPVRRLDEAGVIEQMTKAEVDIQIATAHRFPRDPALCKTRIGTVALADADTAAEMVYILSREDKKTGEKKPIEGPSIRLAEIVAAYWGNMQVGVRLLHEGEKFVTVQAAAHDLESNFKASCEVRRRITNRSGQRYGDDMVQVTVNAAMSIAYRNVVFRVVPKPAWEPTYLAALDMVKKPPAARKGVPPEARFAKAVAAFDAFGVTSSQLLRKVGKASPADLTDEDFASVRGLLTALKEETTTVEESFENAPPEAPWDKDDPDAPPPTAAGADSRKLDLGGKKKDKDPDAPPERQPGQD